MKKLQNYYIFVTCVIIFSILLFILVVIAIIIDCEVLHVILLCLSLLAFDTGLWLIVFIKKPALATIIESLKDEINNLDPCKEERMKALDEMKRQIEENDITIEEINIYYKNEKNLTVKSRKKRKEKS